MEGMRLLIYTELTNHFCVRNEPYPYLRSLRVKPLLVGLLQPCCLIDITISSLSFWWKTFKTNVNQVILGSPYVLDEYLCNLPSVNCSHIIDLWSIVIIYWIRVYRIATVQTVCLEVVCILLIFIDRGYQTMIQMIVGVLHAYEPKHNS